MRTGVHQQYHNFPRRSLQGTYRGCMDQMEPLLFCLWQKHSLIDAFSSWPIHGLNIFPDSNCCICATVSYTLINGFFGAVFRRQMKESESSHPEIPEENSEDTYL
ncbi:hypothetical protein XELAEV_18002113mg [Xenopus laevis]|nr:hypothetical protein XELAEV_18002113mg [Xenopus laevis]